ncbi:hypothetical protein COY16_01010 [Candidatus Roizmanbacteria bacterium CG_4_10_14_0_2_um_filter_39_13]|uniref:Glycosyltransferase family 1 protein n=1 Tax=Candidatus Roizmanbacteria bacterium CG_4_10_14_0_2_um_filter_39_13 TaxID=1974825 RepID=A0A2M7U167_9BACT|nr:MAG: hypothetical protein COY16_01010 [Candidatus Roizmanbacteria bacterium CG_4_10_14_0_2_um_filter_39_13]
MNIGIDGNEANVEKHVGVSVYTLELLKHFAKFKQEGVTFTIFLRNEPKICMPKEHDGFTYEVIPAKVLWSQIFLPFHLLFRSDIDVFFAPAHYAPRFLKQPVIVTIHDLSYVKYPKEFLKKDLYKLNNWTKYSVMKALKIIAVSKTTKKDILNTFQLSEEDVTVVYNGFSRTNISSNISNDVLIQYKLNPKKYLLYVGTLQPRKNVPTLIEAFKEFRKQQSEFKLVLVGKKGWLFDKIYAKVKELNLEEHVIFTGFETDEALTTLYKNAFCFVLPSFYEGFGIPILEAMSAGCPVVTSHASSLPEIGGEACLYFDPNDKNDLLEKLEKLTSDSKLYSTLITEGKKRVKEFSWSKCAEETLSLLVNATKIDQ